MMSSRTRPRTALTALVVCAAILTLSGCRSGSGGGAQASAGSRNAAAQPADPGGARAPSPPEIRGEAARFVGAYETYLFQPRASDADDDLLSFSIAGKPHWADFDPSTGLLTGVPSVEDLGFYEDISISVSDGQFVEALAPFSVEVLGPGDLSITLAWLPPEQNEDGTPLFDLAGYHIRYGRYPSEYPNLIEIDNPGISSYFLDGLSRGTYYFVLSAYNSFGVESALSNEVEISLN